MYPADYAAHDAVGLRELLVRGEVSSADVEAAARSAILQVNRDLNALTGPVFDDGLGYAPDGPLAGVPFLIKDSGPFARGVPFTLGSRSIRGATASVDHELMSRFRAAGLVTLGRTTTPELGLNFATESVRYGPTCNPWDLTRGAGGSSGGAAALVAAGAVPLAHANDAAGSIRVPASCCGLVGLKPSRGRTPVGPLIGEAAFGLVVEFGLSRTVRDTAALLDAVSGPIVGEKYALPPPARRYADQLEAAPGRLRIAVTTDAWSGVPVDRQVAAVATAAAATLGWIGHDVSEASPALDGDTIAAAETLGAIAAGAAMLRASRRPDPGQLETMSRRLLTETMACTALDVVSAQAAQHRVTREVGLFLQRFDLLVTPTVAQLPLRHRTLDYDAFEGDMRSWLERILEFGPFTAPFNIAGNPAISVPLGDSREGLPIGVQLVAAVGREDLLLQVARQLEQAMPWKDRVPPVFVD